MSIISTDWNPELAYIIGLFVTDGSLSKDKRHLSIISKDYEQIRHVADILKLNNKIEEIKEISNSIARKYYRIQFGNIVFYKFLLGIGLTPNKTKTIGEVKISPKYFADFLRGSLDGDGCTYYYWDKRWPNSFMLYTNFVSASIKHIEWLKEQIYYLYNLEGRITYMGKSTYRLAYAKKSSVILFNILYYKKNITCLTRKRLKTLNAINIIRVQAGMAELEYAYA